MDEDGDFGDLYADLDDHVNAGIPFLPPNAAPLDDSRAVPIALDPNVEVSGEERRRGAGEVERSGRGAENGNGGGGSGHLPQPPPLKRARSFMAGKRVNSAANTWNNACLNSWRYWAHDSYINCMNQMVSPGSMVATANGFGMPSMINNGFGFFLPRNKTTFDMGIESFEQMPRRNLGVDNTEFNFGSNKESWKLYGRTLENFRKQASLSSHVSSGVLMSNQVTESEAIQGACSTKAGPTDLKRTTFSCIKPKGRFIQVESGVHERRPSMDVKRSRIRDSDAVIQIKMDFPVEDVSPSNDKERDGNENFDGPIDSTAKLSMLPLDKGDWEDGETVDNSEQTYHRPTKNSSIEASEEFGQPESHEGNCSYSSTEALPETSSCDQIMHSLPSCIVDGSDTVVEKLDGTSGPQYLRQDSANSDDSFSCDFDPLYGEGLPEYYSAENHFSYHYYEDKHRCSRKVSHGVAAGNASLHGGHASSYVQKNGLKRKNSLKKHTKEETRECKLYDRRAYLSFGSERGASSNPKHRSVTDHASRCFSSWHSEKQTNLKNYFGRNHEKQDYSPVRRSSHCDYHGHMHSCLVEKGDHERSLFFEGRLKSDSMRTAIPSKGDWDSSYKMKLKADCDIRMGMIHEGGVGFKHRAAIVERHKRDERNAKEQKVNLDVYQKDIYESSCNYVGKAMTFRVGSMLHPENDARHGRKESCRSGSYHGPCEQRPRERSDSSLAPEHVYGVLHLREDTVHLDSDDIVYKKYNYKDFSADRRELGLHFDDYRDCKGALIPNNELLKQPDFAGAAPIFRHYEDEKLYPPEVPNSGRNSRCSFVHESSVLDEKRSFQGSFLLDSCIVDEKTRDFVCREQNNALRNGKAGSRCTDDQKRKKNKKDAAILNVLVENAIPQGSTSGGLQNKLRTACSADKLNPEEIHRPRNGKDNHIYPISSSDDKVEAHDPSSCPPEICKEQLLQDREDSEIEEGQLIEEPEEICSALNNLNSQTLIVKQNNLKEKIENQQGDTDGSIIVKEFNDSHIRETMEKMKRRAERFKDPIVIKKDPGSDKSMLSPVGTTHKPCETLKQRPARKRHWGGV